MSNVEWFKRQDAENIIARGECPDTKDMTERELAIHLRALERGRQAGIVETKMAVTRQLQLAAFGHVL